MTVGLTVTHQRLMNAIHRRTSGFYSVGGLVTAQDGLDDDLVFLAEHGYVVAHLDAPDQAIDLGAYLYGPSRSGNRFAVSVQLGPRGRTYIRTPTNRLLAAVQEAGDGRLIAVMGAAGVDAQKAAMVHARGLIRAQDARTYQIVEQEAFRTTPPADLIIRLSDKGRQYQPY